MRFERSPRGKRADVADAQILTLAAALLLMVVLLAWMHREDA